MIKNPKWEYSELVLALELYMQFRPNPPGKNSKEVKILSHTLRLKALSEGLKLNNVFRNKVLLVHGRMKEKEKEEVMNRFKNEDFKIVKGEDKLKLYQFHSKVAKHYFCSNCGIYTHHNPRANPAMTGFNLGCIDEINTFELKDVAVNDGQNHPLDKK